MIGINVMEIWQLLARLLNNPASITMNGPITETASFSKNAYTITFQSSPAEGAPVTVNGFSTITPYSITVPYGSMIQYSYGSPFYNVSGKTHTFQGWDESEHMNEILIYYNNAI